MRNYEREFENRVRFIKEIVNESGASGIVYGNSGGKDSALVGILCKAACENTLGLIMPCSSKRNFDMDKADGLEVAEKFGIETRITDLTPQREAAVSALAGVTKLTDMAVANIAPRLRMVTLYAVALSEGRIVAGTGNRSEAYMGYFTKWGDGAHDFNPIGDLTVTEIYEFLEYLDAPKAVRTKSPSAGLFEGQTDEGEMGITYATIDRYLLKGEATEADKAVIERYHKRAKHKLEPIITYFE
ncbi:MAG: NAD(+) synthase [Clostridia bacterium]|nr:NAD(+) synthase [Clostridia bacterium]